MRRKVTTFATVLLLFTFAAAGQSRVSDDKQVEALLEMLSSKKKSPDALLDRAVQSKARKEQVYRFSASDYTLHLTPEGAVAVSGEVATVTAQQGIRAANSYSVVAHSIEDEVCRNARF